jgi:hypothetical protein
MGKNDRHGDDALAAKTCESHFLPHHSSSSKTVTEKSGHTVSHIRHRTHFPGSVTGMRYPLLLLASVPF